MATKKKRKEKQTTEPSDWSPVFELAANVDNLIRHIATSVLDIKSKRDTLFQTDVKVQDAYNELAVMISGIKEEIAAAVDGMPDSPETEVSEDRYPEYLDRYVKLSDLSNKIGTAVVEKLGELTLMVLEDDESEEDVDGK